jgi:hypothetical protein
MIIVGRKASRVLAVVVLVTSVPTASHSLGPYVWILAAICVVLVFVPPSAEFFNDVAEANKHPNLEQQPVPYSASGQGNGQPTLPNQSMERDTGSVGPDQ